MNIESTIIKPTITQESKSSSSSENNNSGEKTSFKAEFIAIQEEKKSSDNSQTISTKQESQNSAALTNKTDANSKKAESGSASSKNDLAHKNETAESKQITKTNAEAENKSITPTSEKQDAKQVLEQNQNNVQNNSLIHDQNKKTTNNTNGSMKNDSKNSPEINELFELKTEIANIKTVQSSDKSNIKKISNKFLTEDQKELKSIKFDSSDAQFFANLVNKDNISLQAKAGTDSNVLIAKNDTTTQNVQTSSVLMDALSESLKTNKPFRIDFDNNISVILKVNKEGKLSADFIPGDAAVENYLRNNISLLQQSFNDQGLSYEQLSYRRHNQQQQENKQNNKQNKENEDE